MTGDWCVCWQISCFTHFCNTFLTYISGFLAFLSKCLEGEDITFYLIYYCCHYLQATQNLMSNLRAGWSPSSRAVICATAVICYLCSLLFKNPPSKLYGCFWLYCPQADFIRSNVVLNWVLSKLPVKLCFYNCFQGLLCARVQDKVFAFSY